MNLWNDELFLGFDVAIFSVKRVFFSPGEFTQQQISQDWRLHLRPGVILRWRSTAGRPITFKRGAKKKKATPWKFNVAPENRWLEDEFPFGIPYFQGLCQLRGVLPPKTDMEPVNGPLEKEIPFGKHPFLWRTVSFRGCKGWRIDSL